MRISFFRGTQSIGKRIIIMIALSVVFISGLIITVNQAFLNLRLREIRNNEIRSTYQYYLKTINNLTEMMELNGLAIAHTGELLYALKGSYSSSRFDELARRFLNAQVREIPIILGRGLWYEPYVLDPGRKYVGPYAYWEKDRVHLTWEYSNSRYDYPRHMWYQIAIPDKWDRGKRREKNLYISSPYPDILDKREVIFVTMSALMYGPGGRIIGVSTTDWSLDVISRHLKNFYITPSSLVFLVDPVSGNILYHPDEKLLMKPVRGAPWGGRLDLSGATAGDMFSESVNIGGDRYLLSYTRTSAGFIFGSLISHDEAFSSIDQIILTNILLALVFIMALGTLLYFFFNRFVLVPLRSLVNFGHDLAQGHLDQRLTPHRDDELGLLAQDMNGMAARLSESISSIKSIIEFMPSMLVNVAPDGRLIQWNRAAERIVSLPPGVEYAPLSKAAPVLDRYWSDIQRVIETGTPLTLYRTTFPGFEDQFFNIHIFTLQSSGKPSAVIRIDDITEMEEKDAQIRAGQKLEVIGLLAGGIAHDFNNILTGILGAVSILRYKLKREGVLSQEILDRELELVETSSESGAAIVSQLLSLARKKQEKDFSLVDLNDLLRQIEKLSSKTFDKCIDIKINYAPEHVYVNGNVSQLQQCFLNLFINAAHAMTIMRKPCDKQGGYLMADILRITADAAFLTAHPESREGEYWKVSVRDTGVGMDSKILSRIFDPFFTTKDRDRVRGTGLGLSVVHNVIRNHNGFIDVYSEPGLGSVFHVYLPLYKKEARTAMPIKQEEIVRGSGTLLVIDDDETALKTTCFMAEECGYTVLSAQDGIEGTEIFKRDPSSVSAVILDLVMPRKSGKETLQDLMAISSNVRILIVSGLYNPELIENLLREGAAGFLQKPFSIEQISRKLKEIIPA